jgi:hypothetical protein
VKREEVKRKAEQEVAYLQASGKITKTPYKTNLGKKKADKKKDTNKEKDDASSEPPSSSRSVPRSAQSSARTVSQSSARTVSTLRADQTDSEFEVIHVDKMEGIL